MKRKLKVFFIINIQLFVIFIILLFVNPEILTSLGGIIIGGIISNGAVYVGGNVTHAWQKSANFRKELKKDIIDNEGK